MTVLAGPNPAQLECDLHGYIPSFQVRWFREDGEELVTSDNYSITKMDGSYQIQTGEAMTNSSILSILSIIQPDIPDAGVYLCGTTRNDTTAINVNVVEPPPPPPVRPGGMYLAFLCCII